MTSVIWELITTTTILQILAAQPAAITDLVDETLVAADRLDTGPVAMNTSLEKVKINEVKDRALALDGEIEEARILAQMNIKTIDEFEAQCKEVQDLLEETEMRRRLILDREAMSKERVKRIPRELEVSILLSYVYNRSSCKMSFLFFRFVFR